LPSVTVSTSDSRPFSARARAGLQQRAADALAGDLGRDVHADDGGLVPVLGPQLALQPDEAVQLAPWNAPQKRMRCASRCAATCDRLLRSSS
jgi:hypothetical protein